MEIEQETERLARRTHFARKLLPKISFCCGSNSVGFFCKAGETAGGRHGFRAAAKLVVEMAAFPLHPGSCGAP